MTDLVARDVRGTDRADVGAPGSHPVGWLRRTAARPEVVVACLWLLVVGPLVQSLIAQSAPRLAMSAAIVDDGTLVIDDYPLGLDFTERDGHVYSDKAPGQPVLALPAYAASRALGAEAAVVRRPDANLTLWWVTVVTAQVPLLVGIFLMAGAIRRRGLDPTIGVLSAMCFGTLLLPLASSLYGHVLAGVLGFAAWSLLDRSRVTFGAALGAGLLAGAAVATEYQMALVVLVLAAWLLVRARSRDLGGFVLGGLPVAALLVAYQRISTGSFVQSGYQTKEWEGRTGFFSTHVTHPPSPSQLAEVLVGSRGLFLYTPVVVLGLVGLVLRWRRHRDDAGPVGLAVLAALLLLQASWANTWAGESPGPRYVAPALPFLAVGVAEVWGRMLPALRAVLVGISVLSMGLATLVYHLMPDGARLVTWHLEVLRTDGPVPTLFTMGLGPAGWLVHLALVAGFLLGVRALRTPEPDLADGAPPDRDGDAANAS